MGTPPAVLLLDDGELDDIQELLEECGIPFARIRGGAIVMGTPAPRDLLVATPHRIDAVDEAVGRSIRPPIRVMVVNEDSNGLREQLRRCGFDYLVRRPVHSEALRLMLLHCCYKGEQRRSEPRVAVGFAVTFRTGAVSRRATLVDLSSRGCRLDTLHRVEHGKRIKVLIPESLDASDPIVALGRVVRVEGDKGAGEEPYRLGVHFESANEDTRQSLASLIDDLSRGPATLRVGADRAPRPADRDSGSTKNASPTANATNVAASAVEDPAAGANATTAAACEPENDRDERRRARRARYAQKIPAFGDRALRVLVGRDLSVGGMRVQRQSEIEVGDRLHLAIYGEAGEEPLPIWGTVDRDDGDGGLFVLFDPIDAGSAQRLERVVTNLPAIESLHDSEAEAMGTVLSEIVEGRETSDSRGA
jgi:hypothetical protein